MDDTLAMGIIQRQGDFVDDGERGLREYGFSLTPLNKRLQPAVKQFHHDKIAPTIFPHIVNMNNVGVLQPRSGFRFMEKATGGPTIFGKGFKKDLYRDIAIQFRIPRKVDVRHPSLTKHSSDAISGNFWKSRHPLSALNRIIRAPATVHEASLRLRLS